MRILVPLLASLLAGSLSAQQPPQPEPEKCTVKGQVVKAGTGEPLKKARILLHQEDRFEKRYTALSDSAGRFTLEDVEPGRYRLRVERTGYVRQEYGQRHPRSSGTTLRLLPGQVLDDVVFRMLPAAVIAGRVYDEDGEQAPGTVLQAMQYRYQEGKRELRSIERTVANDLGEYRLWGLPPGRYYVSATYSPGRSFFFSGSSVTMRGSGDSSKDQDYVPTYYPGTNQPADATPLELQAGDQITGIDFTLLSARTVRVRGRLFNAITGQPERDTWVALVEKERFGRAIFVGPRGGVPDSQGNFEIKGVTPGSYLAIATWSEGERQYMGSARVEVGTQDVEGVQVVIGPGVDVQGNVVVEGFPKAFSAASGAQSNASSSPEGAESDADLSRVQIAPVPRNSIPLNWNPGRIKKDGSFTLENVSNGEYRISVQGLPKDYFLKSARLGGDDLLREDLTISGGALPGPVELLLSPNGARIEGVVLNDEKEPVGGVRVVLVPKPSLRERFELYKTATTDQYGRFEIRGIPPGDYKLFAWVNVEWGAYQDPDFLRPYEKLGIEVEVEEGQALNQHLTAIPGEGTDW